jgi:hypothetical protein
MRIGLINIIPQSGQAGTIGISVEYVEHNDNLDVTYTFDAHCGTDTARKTVFVEGKYDVLEASDGVLTDSSDSELWALKQ